MILKKKDIEIRKDMGYNNSTFYISGVQGAGKTTLCNIISQIKRDQNYVNIILKDMDNFVRKRDNTHYFNKREYLEFMEENKDKHIILCGLLGYLKHITVPEDTKFKYIDLQASQLKANCIYRFFNNKDIYNFMFQPLLVYYKKSQEECSSVVEERFGKDLVYIEQYGLDNLERYICMKQLIEDIFTVLDYNTFDIQAYIDNYLYRLQMKNVSIFLLKIFLTLFYFLPSYSMKKFRFNIWMPIFFFFLPSYKLLDIVNLLFLFSIIRRKFNAKPIQSLM